MTTKEEVMRLCDTAGVMSAMYGDEPIVKLIELAKAQGAAEEREACAKKIEDSIWLSGKDQFQVKELCVQAIRNRERKE